MRKTPRLKLLTLADPVVNALKDLGFFGLGVAALALEGTGWLMDTATKKGKESPPP